MYFARSCTGNGTCRNPRLLQCAARRHRGHYGFIVRILSVQARIALGRGEGDIETSPPKTISASGRGRCRAPGRVPLALAQAYPARPVRILVGFAAGGHFDIVARLIGQWLSDQLHQPVIVENRPGASSDSSDRSGQSCTRDGYTLLLGGAVERSQYDALRKTQFQFRRATSRRLPASLDFPTS